MRYTKLWERIMWQLLFTTLIFFPGTLLPPGGLRVFVLCLANLSLLWAIQRVWSYQPSAEIEKRVQLTKLKLGYTLWLAGIASVSIYIIIGQFIGADLTLILYWLFLPGGGFLAATVGCLLLFQGRTLKAERP